MAPRGLVGSVGSVPANYVISYNYLIAITKVPSETAYPFSLAAFLYCFLVVICDGSMYPNF